MIMSAEGNGVSPAVVDALQEESSVGYRPSLPLEALWMAGSEMPQITLRRDIEFMLMHPIVSAGLDYYKSGIQGAEFWGGPDDANPKNEEGKPISLNPRVAQFVLAHVERFWRCGMPHLQEGGYSHGWAPGEHIYKEVDGCMVWSHLKAFHPSDGLVLTYANQPVGVRVKSIRDNPAAPGDQQTGGSLDMWFATGAVPAKAAWYAHKPRYGQFYGRSQLIGGWRPWRRLGWRDAIEQVIDAAVYRGGYRGPIVRHPREDMQTALTGVPATQADSRGMPRRSARDVARQMVEWAKAGAGFTLSSEQYPNKGGNKWDVEWPEHVMDVRPLIEAAKYVEDQLLLGIGVPPELIRAGGTGSGYSGRSIPREAFLDGQQRVAEAMLQMYVEQVLRPLVLWNFGAVPFNVQCKSLLKTQAGDKQGDKPASQQGQPDDLRRSQAAKDAWQRRKIGSGQPSAPMSLETRDKVLSIVERVMRRRVA